MTSKNTQRGGQLFKNELVNSQTEDCFSKSEINTTILATMPFATFPLDADGESRV